jgi:hypothetical protein
MQKVQFSCILFCLLSIVLGCEPKPLTGSKGGRKQAPADVQGNVSAQEVKLTIDTGDPKVTTFKVPYTEKMTVRDLLKAVEPQGITAEYKGEGEGAMLQALKGIRNEGGGEDAKNWIYYINGKPAWESSAVYSLQPGDAIIWRFEKYE